jgi:GDPmannose 4,6-dehydratase
VDTLLGDASRAREKLGWSPSIDFHGLAEMMVQHDWQLAKDERVLKEHREKGE